MQLSSHDVQQFDDAYIDSLPLDRLRPLMSKVVSDLKEALDRLNQNPDNSSRPPSSRAPWESPTPSEPDEAEPDPLTCDAASEPAGEEEEEGGSEPGGDAGKESAQQKQQKETKPPGKPGKRVGDPGYGRTSDLPVTHEHVHRPDECAACGAVILEGAYVQPYTARYELDLVKSTSGAGGLEIIQTKHTYVDTLCACGHVTRTEPGRCPNEKEWTVALTEWHLAGPMLVAFIAALGMRMRLSRRRTQEFLSDWLGIGLGVATINQCIHEAGRAVEPVVNNEILPAVREAELLYADETGWKEKSRLLWLWVFSGATVTLFIIGRRAREVVAQVLGADFEGWLMTDGYWAYRDYDWRLRCLAHLLRKARGLAQSLDPQAQTFGKRTLHVLERIMETVYQAREGPPTSSLRDQQAIRLDKFWAFCERHWDAEYKKTRELAREFLYDWDAIWAVLDDPWLPLTNNEAERALRHWVISRRISFGTRTAQGTKAFSLLASVIETCRKRNVSPWPYIAEVVTRRRKGQDAPPLPLPATV